MALAADTLAVLMNIMISSQVIRKGFCGQYLCSSWCSSNVSRLACNSCLQVRGKTVYLQYSTRQEIVHSKQPLDGPSNVLLVTMDNLDVSLSLLLVCLLLTA